MGVFEAYGLDFETKRLTFSKKMFEKLKESTSLFSKLTGNILEPIWKHQSSVVYKIPETTKFDHFGL